VCLFFPGCRPRCFLTVVNSKFLLKLILELFKDNKEEYFEEEEGVFEDILLFKFVFVCAIIIALNSSAALSATRVRKLWNKKYKKLINN